MHDVSLPCFLRWELPHQSNTAFVVLCMDRTFIHDPNFYYWKFSPFGLGNLGGHQLTQAGSLLGPMYTVHIGLSDDLWSTAVCVV